MRRVRSLVVVLLLGLVPVAFAAGSDACTPPTQPAFAVGNHYVWVPPSGSIMGISVELWQESNGAPGLQRGSTSCVDGTSIPRDTCITHTVTSQLITCLLSYPGP